MSFTFKELGIPGLILVQPLVFPDERGFFQIYLPLPGGTNGPCARTTTCRSINYDP